MVKFVEFTIFAMMTFCCLFAAYKYKKRTGKKGWVFSSLDYWRYNREEMIWSLCVVFLGIVLLIVMVMFGT